MDNDYYRTIIIFFVYIYLSTTGNGRPRPAAAGPQRRRRRTALWAVVGPPLATAMTIRRDDDYKRTTKKRARPWLSTARRDGGEQVAPSRNFWSVSEFDVERLPEPSLQAPRFGTTQKIPKSAHRHRVPTITNLNIIIIVRGDAHLLARVSNRWKPYTATTTVVLYYCYSISV